MFFDLDYLCFFFNFMCKVSSICQVLSKVVGVASDALLQRAHVLCIYIYSILVFYIMHVKYNTYMNI